MNWIDSYKYAMSVSGYLKVPQIHELKLTNIHFLLKLLYGLENGQL